MPEILYQDKLENFIKSAEQIIFGKQHTIKLALTCLLARGHLLIEDLPGVGKTTLAHVFAQLLGLQFNRIQFTSDMLPADVLGISVYDQAHNSFSFHPGPIFSNIILADEINRATPKTQSALLEAMEEQQITVEGQTRVLDDPFFVIATQNPMEQIGTFPLPESQLDRFLLSVSLGYPDKQAERKLLTSGDRRTSLKKLSTVIDQHTLQKIQQQVDTIHASDVLLDYVQNILTFSRQSDQFYFGLSPRAGLALVHVSKAWAMLHGRDHVIPEDIQAVLPSVANHRLQLADTINQKTPADILLDLPLV